MSQGLQPEHPADGSDAPPSRPDAAGSAADTTTGSTDGCPFGQAAMIAAKNLIKDIGDPVFRGLSLREYRRREAALGPFDAPSAIAEMTRRYRGWGWYKRLDPLQVQSEYEQLIGWAIRHRPKVIVEIGTARGGTLWVWSRVATDTVASIDLPGGIHGGGYPAKKARLFRELFGGQTSPRLLLYRADSQSEATHKQVAKDLEGKPVDLLFIDGDHRLEGVTRDFELWRDLVRPGGHIAFHDIAEHTGRPDCQVDKLWAKLKERYPHEEFIEDPEQGWAGIGIIRL